MPMKASLPLVVSIALVATVVYAAEQRVTLKDGPGRDKVEGNARRATASITSRGIRRS
jgi:hypothetical protein